MFQKCHRYNTVGSVQVAKTKLFVTAAQWRKAKFEYALDMISISKELNPFK